MDETKFNAFCDKTLDKTSDMSEEQVATLAGKIMSNASMSRTVVEAFLQQFSDAGEKEEFALQVESLYNEDDDD